MNDNEIIEQLYGREPQAVEEMIRQYGGYCGYIARNFLSSREDQEECLNDTWLHAWNSIPPNRPEHLGAFLGRITRNLALNRLRQGAAQKRGGGTIPVVLEELADCISDKTDVQTVLEQKQLAETINCFLGQLNREKRVAFVRRYYYGDSVASISQRLECSQSRIKSMLHRTRKQLREFLEQEGVVL